MKKPRKQAVKGTGSPSPVVLSAFSVDHAARVTQLSKARLTRWDRLGFFSPEYADDSDKGNPYSRVYSYTDLVGLRTLKILTDVHRVPLEELRKAHEILSRQVGKPWSEIALSVCKRKVVTDLQGHPRNVTDGQAVLKHIPLPTIASEVAARAAELRTRDNSKLGVFERHKFVAHNAQVIAGTRIPVSAVASFIRAGYSDEAIVSEYPTLTLFDVSTVRRQSQAAA